MPKGNFPQEINRSESLQAQTLQENFALCPHCLTGSGSGRRQIFPESRKMQFAMNLPEISRNAPPQTTRNEFLFGTNARRGCRIRNVSEIFHAAAPLSPCLFGQNFDSVLSGFSIYSLKRMKIFPMEHSISIFLRALFSIFFSRENPLKLSAPSSILPMEPSSS